MRHSLLFLFQWIAGSAGSNKKHQVLSHRNIASKVPGKTMRECITRVKELAEVVNETTSKNTKSPSIGNSFVSSKAHKVDLTSCKPVDVLLPYYPKLSTSSQKYALYFGMIVRRIELALRDYSQALQIDSERIRSVFRLRFAYGSWDRTLLGRYHYRSG